MEQVEQVARLLFIPLYPSWFTYSRFFLRIYVIQSVYLGEYSFQGLALGNGIVNIKRSILLTAPVLRNEIESSMWRQYQKFKYTLEEKS